MPGRPEQTLWQSPMGSLDLNDHPYVARAIARHAHPRLLLGRQTTATLGSAIVDDVEDPEESEQGSSASSSRPRPRGRSMSVSGMIGAATRRMSLSGSRQ